MCKSLAQGGQRCAAHTRARLTAKSDALEAAVAADDLTALVAAQSEWETAAAEYASTREGNEHLRAQAVAADAADDFETMALLNTVIAKGEAMQAANKDAAAFLRAARLSQSAPSLSEAATGKSLAPVGPSAPDMSPEMRAQWDSSVAGMEELLPHFRSVWAGGGPVYVSDVRKDLPEIDTVLGDPAADDKSIAIAVRTACRYGEFRMQHPKWERPKDDPRDHDQMIADERALSDRWQQVSPAFSEAAEAQAKRGLEHPNAGITTFATYEEKAYNATGMLTSHPNAPLDYLKDRMRNAPTKVHEDGWERARTERFEDNSLAVVMAVSDPDTFHRNEALNQVMMMPMDSVSAADRMHLAKNLSKVPGSPENQRTLAYSLQSWASGFADADERKRLSAALTKDGNTEAVKEIGRSLTVADQAAVSLVREEPKKRRGWLRSS
jgi:hypothetical protein